MRIPESVIMPIARSAIVPPDVMPYVIGIADDQPHDFIRNVRHRIVADQPQRALASPFLIGEDRSEEHTSELQSLMRISYAVFCLKKKNITKEVNNIKEGCKHPDNRRTTHTIISKNRTEYKHINN